MISRSQRSTPRPAATLVTTQHHARCLEPKKATIVACPITNLELIAASLDMAPAVHRCRVAYDALYVDPIGAGGTSNPASMAGRILGSRLTGRAASYAPSREVRTGSC